MANRGQTVGGYPQSTTALVTPEGFIPSIIDDDIIPKLKAQEVALSPDGTGKMQANMLFELTNFSIRVDAPTWIVLDDGTEIPVDSIDGLVPFDAYTRSLKFKTEVNYKIVYTY